MGQAPKGLRDLWIHEQGTHRFWCAPGCEWFFVGFHVWFTAASERRVIDYRKVAQAWAGSPASYKCFRLCGATFTAVLSRAETTLNPLARGGRVILMVTAL